MGLTERHWFEDDEPALTDRQLEDIVYENKKAYDNGYVKGFHDAKTLEEYFVELGVKIGFLTQEKAKQLLKEHQQIIRCKDCKFGQYEEWDNGECVDKSVYCDGYGIHKPDWFCADGEKKDSDDKAEKSQSRIKHRQRSASGQYKGRRENERRRQAVLGDHFHDCADGFRDFLFYHYKELRRRVTMKMSPCKDCEDRTPECHPGCKKYREWRVELDRTKEWLRGQLPIENRKQRQLAERKARRLARGQVRWKGGRKYD